MTAEFEKAVLSVNDDAPADGTLQTALFDAICEGLQSAFFVYDKNDTLLFASRQVLNFYPISEHLLRPQTRLRDFLGAVFDTGIRQRDVAGKRPVPSSREDWLSQTIATHWRERYEFTERHGADRWVRFTKRRLSSGYGVCIITDISETRKREEQWRADLERVQLTEDILDNLPFPLFVKDRDLTYVAVNKALCDKYQKSADEILGRKSSDLFSTDVAQRFGESDQHVIDTGDLSISRQRQIDRSGMERDIVTRKLRIGKPGRYFLVATMQDLPTDGADFDEFGLASAITESGDRSYRRAYVPVETLQAALHRLPAMETFTPETFNGQKILLVTNDLAAESTALKMLAKYGFEACVVRSEGEEAAFLDFASSLGVRIDLVVIDNQIGVRGMELAERQNIPALCLDGAQLANELTFRIARYFNRNMRGKRLAPKHPDEKIWPISISTEDNSCEILVAEDNAINKIVFSQILEGLGYSYKIASTGDEAVRMWTEYRPQLMLMDITLPGLNGFEATRLIRQVEAGSASRTPIVGVLTQALDQDRDACFASGMDDVILKPVSPDMLQLVFLKHLGNAQARETA